jgi:transposase
MAAKHPKYSESYKAEAVKLYLESGQSIAEVARGLGINETTLGEWIKKARKAAASADGEAPPSAQELRRIRDLEAEVRRLNLELAFLKKASAYFASQSL